ncbi:MAG: ROK family protein [Pseudomonadota bacterium]|nr:ROK family protein [Pseudomonadota bacterium]
MSFHTGLDIGGTKIAGAVFGRDGLEISQAVLPTPHDYTEFLIACRTIVDDLDRLCGGRATVGIGIPGVIDREKDNIFAPNVPCLQGHTFQADITRILNRPVAIGNDASCASLSEAVDGAGAGHHIVFGVIMGTGVGGGMAVDGKMVDGPHGLTGEWGHLPLPYRDEKDGAIVACGCGQRGCIDKTISGPALSRLFSAATGQNIEASQIGALASGGDLIARQVLDQFYSTVAKAMVTIIHGFDPNVIVVSGGLSSLPGLYAEVPKRWEVYAVRKNLRTRLLPATHGTLTGLRGAAWLGSAKAQCL